ncbi:MAG: pyridine nucleotide-disulfide oxidoreductase [Hyphomicrobiales bacterium]|nr:MAG: pyridine nucleotide-disulfide oxidoreductase [Hyphomicrobiales bacterium]
MAGIVIAGAGQAGFQCAESLRQHGFDGPISLIGEEASVPYQRPPLSKAYLLGESDHQRLKFRDDGWYGEHDIDLRTGVTVTGIDRAGHAVGLSSGGTLGYQRLVLALGARVRPLPVPGAELDQVCYLKTIADVDRIAARLETADQVVVIGAGFIGLEFAAVARKFGKQVTVLEAAERVMGRAVSATLSGFFEQAHEARGVRILCNCAVTRINPLPDGRVGVEAGDGAVHEADLVVAGIGVVPNTELAAEAGLACDNGIAVDGFGQTSDKDIFAAGDCASTPLPFAGRRLRLESVQNAVDQAKCVAASLAGAPQAYDRVPWFWSDQFELKLQMAGLIEGCDSHVSRGDMAAGKFSLFHFRAGQLRAVDAVNKAADYIMGRKLLEAGLSPSPEQVADESFKLKSLLG